MEEVKLDAKEEVKEVASSTTETAEPKVETTSPDAKAEEPKAEAKTTEPVEEPWHKDKRFKDFLTQKKELEEKAKSLESLNTDPDFAAFLAFKRSKEAMSKQTEESEEDKISSMTPKEFAEYVANKSVERVRSQAEKEREAMKQMDGLTDDAVRFAEGIKIDKATFQKDYAPKIVGFYESKMKEIGQENIDKYIRATPPKDVLKMLLFDKAGEAGVEAYKQKIDSAKKASFDVGGGNPSSKRDAKSNFEEEWQKHFGSSEELPLSAFSRSKG